MISAAGSLTGNETPAQCGSCGASNASAAKFCAECGQALSPRPDSAEALPPGGTRPQVAAHRSPRFQLLVVASVVILSLALAAVGIWHHSIGTSAIEESSLSLSEKDWSHAIAAGARARSALPLVFDTRAEAIASTARRENEALAKFTEARDALEAEQWDVVQTKVDSIHKDSVYSGEAAQIRSRAEQAKREEQEAQQALNDGRLAMRLGKWDDAMRILSTVPATRIKAVASARDVSERSLLAKQTEGVANAYRQFSAATTRLNQTRDRLRLAGGFAERLTMMSLTLDAANEILNASRILQNALRPNNGSSLPPARLLADSGTPLIGSASTLTAVVAGAAQAGTLTESQFSDLYPSLLKVHEWAVPLFVGEEKNNPGTAARMLNSDQPITPTIRGFAGNPNEQAQVLLGWVTATAAGSVAEGEEIFGYFVNDTVAEGARRALAQRLKEPLTSTVYGQRAVPYLTAPIIGSPMAGELPPGTVVEQLGSVFASAADGEATKSEWLSRVRLRPSGQVIYIQRGFDMTTQFVSSDEQGVIRGASPALQDTIRFYLASRQRGLYRYLSEVVTGQVLGNGKAQLVTMGSPAFCSGCNERWITVWDIERRVPVWESDVLTDAISIALRPEGDGFDRVDGTYITAIGPNYGSLSKLTSRAWTWNGTTFVPGAATEFPITRR